MSYEDDVMFKLGVVDDPANVAQLESLASSVESAMEAISASVRGVGATVDTVSGRMRQEANRSRLESSAFEESAVASSRLETESEVTARLIEQNEQRRRGLELQTAQREAAAAQASASSQAATSSPASSSVGAGLDPVADIQDQLSGFEELRSEVERNIDAFKSSAAATAENGAEIEASARALKEEMASLLTGFGAYQVEMGKSPEEMQEIGNAALQLAREYGTKIDEVASQAIQAMNKRRQDESLAKLEPWRPLTAEQMAANAYQDEPRDVSADRQDRREQSNERIRQRIEARKEALALEEKITSQAEKQAQLQEIIAAEQAEMAREREQVKVGFDLSEIQAALDAEAEGIDELRGQIEDVEPLSASAIIGDVSQTVEGISKLAQGLAFLGLASDETAEKIGGSGQALIKGLLAIKGIGDVATGTAKTIQNMTELYGRYSQRTARQAAAEANLEQQTRATERATGLYENALEMLNREARDAGMSQDRLEARLREIEQSARRAGVEIRGLASDEDRLARSGRGAAASPGGARRGRSRLGGLATGLVGSFVGDAVYNATGSSTASQVGDMGAEVIGDKVASKFTAQAISSGLGSAGSKIASGVLGSAVLKVSGSIAGFSGGGLSASAGASTIAAGGGAGLAASAGPVAAFAAAIGGAVASLNLFKEVLIDGKEIHETTNAKVAESLGVVGLIDYIAGWQSWWASGWGELGSMVGGDLGRVIAERVSVGLIDIRSLGTGALQAAASMMDLELSVLNSVAAMDAQSQAIASIQLGGQRQIETINQNRVGSLRGVDQAAIGKEQSGAEKLVASRRLVLQYSMQYLDSVELANRGEEGARLTYERQVQEIERGLGLNKKIEAEMRSQVDIVRTMAVEQKKASDAQIDSLEKQKEKWGEIGQAARDSLKSAAERFADLDEEGRDQFKDAIEAARAQAQSGQRVRLSKEEESALASVGDEESQELLRRSKQNRASDEGFFDIAGRRERQKIAQSQRGGLEAEAEIQRKRAEQEAFQGKAQGKVDEISGQLRSNINRSAGLEKLLVENQVQVELRQNSQSVMDAVRKALADQFPKQKKELEASIQKVAAQEIDRIQKQSNSQRRNSGA